MEFLLLLLIPVALGSLLIGGGGDDDDAAPEIDTVEGTDQNDVMRGATDADAIDGGYGDDLLFGYGGADTLQGGEDNDFIDGGNSDDLLIGDAGHDVLAGAVGDDSLSGGQGNDLLSGGAGDDTISGGNGDDLLVGSTGADQLYGGYGDDFLDGATPTPNLTATEAFSDLREEFSSAFNSRYGQDATDADFNRFMRDLASEAADYAPDMLDGGAGNDYVVGDNGDTLTGGVDADYFELSWVSGNAPVHITDYSSSDQGITVYVDEPSDTLPEFGMRDAADGTGVELVIDGAVVAALANAAVADLSGEQIVMILPGDDAVYSAIRLPTLAA